MAWGIHQIAHLGHHEAVRHRFAEPVPDGYPIASLSALVQTLLASGPRWRDATVLLCYCATVLASRSFFSETIIGKVGCQRLERMV